MKISFILLLILCYELNRQIRKNSSKICFSFILGNLKILDSHDTTLNSSSVNLKLTKALKLLLNDAVIAVNST